MSNDVRWASDVSAPLNSPEELKEYIKNLAERFKDKQDFETRLYLRGDQKALFKGSREVIRVAGGMRSDQSGLCRAARQELRPRKQGRLIITHHGQTQEIGTD